MTHAPARHHRHNTRFVGALIALAVVLFACSAAPQADAAKSKRVVAISPFAAQAMIQLGVKPIRVGDTIGATGRQNRMFRGIPRIKLSHPNGPNLEVMAKLKPDVVFTSSRWAKGTPAMKRLGIRVVNADPTRTGQIYPTVKKIGRILGRNKQARRLTTSIRKSVNRATRPGKSNRRPDILVVLGIGTTAMAFLDNSWGGQLVRAAKGNLVTGGATNSGGFARLSDEVVVAENPDVIVVVPHGNSDDLDQVADYVLNNEAWKTTDAVKKKQVYVSTHNELLQAGTDVGSVIGQIRSKWLKNW